MSTNQLFLTKQGKKVSTETKVEISSEQSQKLIQTMLTMSVGCLAFLRGLFPDEYFLDQRFVPERKERRDDKDKHINSIKIKTLVKGKSKEIDLLLDWLEQGVFQSIKLKYLKALSLGIFLDEDKPNDLFENYIFTFDYNDKDNSVSLSIDTQDSIKEAPVVQNNEIITLKDSRKMVQQLMRRFIIITQSLEPLPEEKFLSMRLLFNENVNPTYQPNLFKDATFQPRPTIKVARSLENNLFNVGKLNTGHHNCKLAVLSTCANMGHNQDTNEDMVNLDFQEIDPLQQIIDSELLERDKVEQVSLLTQNEPTTGSHSKMDNIQQSQTTNYLGKFLNSCEASIVPTQIEPHLGYPTNKTTNAERRTCECNTSLENTIGQTKICWSCGRVLHNLCYGNTTNSRIECFTRLFEFGGSDKLNASTTVFHKLMIVRKTYRAVNKLLGRPPTSLSEYMLRVFNKEECKNAQNVEDFVFSLNCLFHDKTLQLTSDKTTSTRFSISCDILVDIPGVKTADHIPLMLEKKYPITFHIGNRNGNPCYLKIVPKSKEEISQWIEGFKRLETATTSDKSFCKDIKENGFNNEENDIINISSLAIQDTQTQDPIQICKKRKGLDLEQYLNMEESFDIPDTYNIKNATTNPENSNKRKIRKISVSKGTVKSAF